MEGVVNILVRQVKGDDLAVAGVNANVQLAPSAALCRAMFFKQPFAGPAQFQSRTVDDQVKFARSNPRWSFSGNRRSLEPIQCACVSAKPFASMSFARAGIVKTTSCVAARNLNIKRRAAAERLSLTR